MPDEKKRIAYVTEEIKLSGENKVEGDVLVNLPSHAEINGERKDRELKKNEIFHDWDKVDDIEEERPQVELHLPEILHDE